MRKLGLISSLWAALLFFPLSGHALGLGEIEISSFLNQPLKAEISVISARPGEIDDLLISLASRDAFQKAGLDRPAELSKLRFNIEKSEDGQSATVLVTTKTPVIEPFLSFLVEADWAKGRLLREFTVLLDPPSFAQQAEQPATAVAPEAQPKSNQQLIERSAPARVEKPASQPADTQTEYNPPIAMSGDDSSIRVESRSLTSENNMPAEAGLPAQLTVGKGDTLWRIATDLKDRNQSVAQMMLALQVENPAAFGRNNINNLKVGAILRVPEPASVNRLSKQEAQAQVLDQNGLWDDYLARKSGSTTRGAPAAVADAGGAQKKPKSQLKLVAPGDGKSDVASLKSDATTSSDNQLRKQLALAEEELEAARLQNNELNSRVQILEQQLSKFEELQNMVQIQDNSLAQLQKSVSDSKSATTPQPGSKAMAEAGSTPDIDPLLESAIVDTMPTQKMVEAAGEMMKKESKPALEKTPAGGPPAPASDMQEAATARTSEQAPPSLEPTADELIPAPVIVTEVSGPVLDDDLMNMLPSLDGLMKDPVVLGGLGGVLALILGFLFLKRKKTDKSESAEGITLEGPDSLLDDDVTPVHVPSAADEEKDISDIELDPTTEFKAVSVDTKPEEEDEDEFARTAIISAEEMPEMEEAPSAEQDDVLNEVDVYLAYGLYDNAEDLLNESLENSPERADYRAKLLDTYFATKNRDAFIREATILKSQGKAANRFWDRIQVMGFELAPDNDLFSDAEGKDLAIEDLEYTRPASADFDIGAEDDGLNQETDFDLSGDGEADSFDISSTDITKIAGEEEPSTEQSEMINIDFPDLDENEEENLFETDDLLKQDEEDPTEHTLADDLETLNFDGEMEDFRAQTEDENKQEDEDLSFDLSDDTGELLEQQDDKDAQSKSESGLITDEVPVVEEMQLDATMDDLGAVDRSPASKPSDDVETTDQKVDAETQDIVKEDESVFDKTHIVAPGSDLEDEGVFDKTHIIAPGSDPDSESAESPESEISLDEGLDFDMSDMDEADLHTGRFTPSEMDEISESSAREDDITEFKPADFIDEFEKDNAENLAAEELEDVEEIDIEDDIEGFDVDESIEDIMDDINLDDGIKVEEDFEDVDLGGIDEDQDLLDEASIASDSGDDDLTKTGTFAPGDFKEDTITQDDLVAESDELDGLDDIEDLMLPDDVDEVGTKLDLARAFMDMGDLEGARSSLEEVMTEGTEEQKAEAGELMNQMK